MNAHATASETATAISTIGGRFMLDGETYKRSAEIGFQGIDFYDLSWHWACSRPRATDPA